MEKFPFRINGTDTGFQSVTENDKGIMIEQLRYGVQIVPVILVKSILHFHIVVLQLDKQ